jgi:hypothetical protein
MAIPPILTRRDHLTHKGNLKQTRYGWLRLTPAYSVHLVAELLDMFAQPGAVVLDPFCGTGTTALVCAERGIECDTTDINPFLLWLCEAKAHSYSFLELEAFQGAATAVINAIQAQAQEPLWVPPLHQIEKWWNGPTLNALSRAMYCIRQVETSLPIATTNLLKIAFCRTMIEQSNASFGHQSMSFKKQTPMLDLLDMAEDAVAASWQRSVTTIAIAAHSLILQQPRAMYCDARTLTRSLEPRRYSCVITSPPYPNRMSYIRELRPYMYWLGYLNNGREAGELDWQAIGGTWGVATSNLTKWIPTDNVRVPFEAFDSIVEDIRSHSPVLSRYVQKYFYDMVQHCTELATVVQPGGTVAYVVGNSKFYDVMLPVEELFAGLFNHVGFMDVNVRVVRKRTSKKELFEYVVTARKP